MGLRGPAPKPTALKLLQSGTRGYDAGHRPINAAEPKPEEKAPPCPAYIREDPEAAKEWKRLVPILLRMRVLTEADTTVLASLCLTHSHMLRSLAAMRALNAVPVAAELTDGEEWVKVPPYTETLGIAGMVIETKTGYLAANQIYLNVMSAMDQEVRLCKELGLTPSARSRLQTSARPQQKPANKWDATKPTPTSKQA
jgi:P27 family predicted phage terminase small subunit